MNSLTMFGVCNSKFNSNNYHFSWRAYYGVKLRYNTSKPTHFVNYCFESGMSSRKWFVY